MPPQEVNSALIISSGRITVSRIWAGINRIEGVSIKRAFFEQIMNRHVDGVKRVASMLKKIKPQEPGVSVSSPIRLR